jgi:hypothetical protein
MASDMLCCPGGTRRFDENGTGPGPSTAVSTDMDVRGCTVLGASHD